MGLRFASVTGTEHAITADLIAELLREQHPDLAGLPLTFGARGWDNQLWRLGDDLAVRLPWATQDAGELLLKEHALLPAIAPRLPFCPMGSPAVSIRATRRLPTQGPCAALAAGRYPRHSPACSSATPGSTAARAEKPPGDRQQPQPCNASPRPGPRSHENAPAAVNADLTVVAPAGPVTGLAVLAVGDKTFRSERRQPEYRRRVARDGYSSCGRMQQGPLHV